MFPSGAPSGAAFGLGKGVKVGGSPSCRPVGSLGARGNGCRPRRLARWSQWFAFNGASNLRRLCRTLGNTAEVIHGDAKSFRYHHRRLKERARLAVLIVLNTCSAHASGLSQLLLAHAGVCSCHSNAVSYHRLEVGQSTHPPLLNLNAKPRAKSDHGAICSINTIAFAIGFRFQIYRFRRLTDMVLQFQKFAIRKLRFS